MGCFVCHKAVNGRAKKCSVCGAPTALGKGDFLFEMDTADKNQLKKYYEQGQAHEAEMKAAAQETTSTTSEPQTVSAPASAATVSTYTAPTTRYKSPMEKISDFISYNDTALLKGCAWASLVLGVIGLMWRPAVIFGIALLAFSVYIMLFELFYSDEPMFWICSGVALLIAIICGVWGWLDYAAAPDRLSTIINSNIEAAQKHGVDVKVLLNNVIDFQFSGCALSLSSIFPLNMAIVRHEKKGTTGSLVLLFVGYALFLLILGFSAYSFGSFICINDVITDYIANLAV